MTTTILAQKLNFLTAQTHLLNAPLRPSRQWTRDNATADNPLPQHAVDDALARLAIEIRQHGRRMYAPQVMRNLAEQIEDLYLGDAERKTEGVGGDGVGREVDFDQTITALPPTWPSEHEATTHPAEAQRYADLHADLARLSASRSAVRERVGRLRRMRDLVQPFDADASGRGVQENLVTRDGEVERALGRMRMLLVRVAGRLRTLEGGDDEMEEREGREDGNGGGEGDGERARVDRLLEGL